MQSRQHLGHSAPLGATLRAGGANFSVFSRSAAAIELLLFDREDDPRPSRIVPLDPHANHTYHYWHCFLPDLQPGQIYAYRAQGPFNPAAGHRFDPQKVLLDPYGRCVAVPKGYDRQAARRPGDNAATAMKSVLLDPLAYDWQGDEPLRTSSVRTIIYEMHVRGFTANPNSGLAEPHRGTYRGLIDKIPYLKQLGITAVELLPIFQFDAHDCPAGVVNYWGYQPVSFFSPHRAYSSDPSPLGPVNEFREMVKALHAAGLEVILDVVFNHTSEGDHTGPTLSFRGLDNAAYYILQPDRARYADFSGCGNTLNANHPIVRRMILDSIRYWVQHMHVDGFRFDLASVLARDSAGQPLANPPVLWDLESDPVLAGTKLIAEAWDAAGLYQVGTFVGDSWKEWNGRFRDDARSFFRGDSGALRRFADRLVGSPEIYAHKQREPEQSVNFITCHDGYTLNDLVSYERKHNEANNDNNRDGCNDNLSCNWGVEGPTDDPAIESLRNRLVKNFLAVTMISVGVPMILMGDEVRRTQNGNNNNYCHNDASNWFDWSLLKKHPDVHRFVSLLCARRTLRSVRHEEQRLSLDQLIGRARHVWHGVKLFEPDWGDTSHCIAFTAGPGPEGLAMHIMLNAHDQAHDFALPPAAEYPTWRRWIDTALPSPDDICDWAHAPNWLQQTYRVQAHSLAILFAGSRPS